MVVLDEGQMVGTVGGGCGEAQVLWDAVRVLRQGPPMISRVDLTGEINGNAVKFRYKVNALEFEYAGTLESSGTAMTGMVSVSGMTANFSATKK